MSLHSEPTSEPTSHLLVDDGVTTAIGFFFTDKFNGSLYSMTWRAHKHNTLDTNHTYSPCFIFVQLGAAVVPYRLVFCSFGQLIKIRIDCCHCLQVFFLHLFTIHFAFCCGWWRFYGRSYLKLVISIEYTLYVDDFSRLNAPSR